MRGILGYIFKVVKFNNLYIYYQPLPHPDFVLERPHSWGLAVVLSATLKLTHPIQKRYLYFYPNSFIFMDCITQLVFLITADPITQLYIYLGKPFYQRERRINEYALDGGFSEEDIAARNVGYLVTIIQRFIIMAINRLTIMLSAFSLLVRKRRTYHTPGRYWRFLLLRKVIHSIFLRRYL